MIKDLEIWILKSFLTHPKIPHPVFFVEKFPKLTQKKKGLK